MNKIERYTDWCDIARLEGVDLNDGDLLRIHWPDSTQTIETILVKKSWYETNDMGVIIPVSSAYVTRSISGVEALVPIDGLCAERLKG